MRAPDTSAPDTLQPDAWRPWHQPDFAARQHITLRNDSSEALVDFPVLVRLGQGCVDLGQLRADRADLLFVDADSGDRLVHEIDWSSATALHLWVRVPRLRPSGDTGLLLYYQSPTATPTPLSAEVWDEHFRAVWHMGQSAPGDVLIDSTGNANHASMSLILAIEPGVAGEARRGNGANTTQAPHHSSLDLGDATGMTLEAWVNPDVVEAVNVYLLQKSGAYSLANSRVYSSARPELLIRILNGGDNAEAVAAPEPVSPQSWTYLAGTYAPSEHVLRIYVNGALSAANMLSLALDPWRVEDSTNQLLMGNGLYGLLDELRISAVQRSPGWIAAQHAALQGDLVRFGACELAD